MTKKDKDLLLKDLCARLPYGVYCQIRYKRKNKVLEECKQLDGVFFNNIECLFRSESGAEYSVDYKPYLRPMSSMTEEEHGQYMDFIEWSYNDYNGTSTTCIDKERLHKYLDFIYSHHLDDNNFIEKGLALEALDDMYKIE